MSCNFRIIGQGHHFLFFKDLIHYFLQIKKKKSYNYFMSFLAFKVHRIPYNPADLTWFNSRWTESPHVWVFKPCFIVMCSENLRFWVPPLENLSILNKSSSLNVLDSKAMIISPMCFLAIRDWKWTFIVKLSTFLSIL